MSETIRRVLVGVLVFLSLTAFSAFLFLSQDVRREQGKELTELNKRIRKTCSTGAGSLVIAEVKLVRGDADAVAMAQDLLVYGLPWLDLCASYKVQASVFLEDDNLEAVLAEVRKLRADLEHWR